VEENDFDDLFVLFASSGPDTSSARKAEALKRLK